MGGSEYSDSVSSKSEPNRKNPAVHKPVAEESRLNLRVFGVFLIDSLGVQKGQLCFFEAYVVSLLVSPVLGFIPLKGHCEKLLVYGHNVNTKPRGRCLLLPPQFIPGRLPLKNGTAKVAEKPQRKIQKGR